MCMILLELMKLPRATKHKLSLDDIYISCNGIIRLSKSSNSTIHTSSEMLEYNTRFCKDILQLWINNNIDSGNVNDEYMIVSNCISEINDALKLSQIPTSLNSAVVRLGDLSI